MIAFTNAVEELNTYKGSDVRKLFYKNIIKMRYNVLKDVFIKLNVNKFI